MKCRGGLLVAILGAAFACGRQSPDTSSPASPRPAGEVESAPAAALSTPLPNISLAAAEEPSAEQVLRDILLSGKVAVKAGLECVEWGVEVSAKDATTLRGTLIKHGISAAPRSS